MKNLIYFGVLQDDSPVQNPSGIYFSDLSRLLAVEHKRNG